MATMLLWYTHQVKNINTLSLVVLIGLGVIAGHNSVADTVIG